MRREGGGGQHKHVHVRLIRRKRAVPGQRYLAQDKVRHDAAPVGIYLEEAFDAQPAHLLWVAAHVLDLVAEGAQDFGVHGMGVQLWVDGGVRDGRGWGLCAGW